MRRKKGDLPGRYVPPHIRKHPNEPGEYVNVSDYQERVEALPSPVEITPPQGELDLMVVEKNEEEDGDEEE